MDRTRDCLIDLKMHSFKRNLLTPLGGANEKPPSGTGSTFITPEIARTMGSKKEIEKKKKRKLKNATRYMSLNHARCHAAISAAEMSKFSVVSSCSRVT